MHNPPHDRMSSLRETLRETLAQARRWNELPALLEAMDAVRRQQIEASVTATRTDGSTVLWVDTFADELAQQAPAIDSGIALRTARELMPWLGVYDPVALARGRWVDLRKSYG